MLGSEKEWNRFDDLLVKGILRMVKSVAGTRRTILWDRRPSVLTLLIWGRPPSQGEPGLRVLHHSVLNGSLYQVTRA